uniref:C-type lectin domain-containing protein n=1 Tax=Acrobeloides nanus TaxID=290746 RepID=A0A914DSY7_9BILA
MKTVLPIGDRMHKVFTLPNLEPTKNPKWSILGDVAFVFLIYGLGAIAGFLLHYGAYAEQIEHFKRSPQEVRIEQTIIVKLATEQHTRLLDEVVVETTQPTTNKTTATNITTTSKSVSVKIEAENRTTTSTANTINTSTTPIPVTYFEDYMKRYNRSANEEMNFIMSFQFPSLMNKTIGGFGEGIWLGVRLDACRERREAIGRNMDGTPLDYTKFAPFEPNYYETDENCVMYYPMYLPGMYRSYIGYWNDESCGSRSAYGFVYRLLALIEICCLPR